MAALLCAALVSACSDDSSLEGRYPGGKKENKEEGGQTGGQTETPKPADGIYKILFIGNSLTLDATTLLPCFLNAAGVTNVQMGRTFHGAYTLPLYNSNWSNANICSYCTWKLGYPRWKGVETTDHSPEDAIKAEEWDIVCIQEYSGNQTAWSWSAAEKAAVTGLIDKINTAHPDHKPEIVFMFSHTFGTGYERLVDNFANDNVTQFNTCAGVVKNIVEETQIEKVISTAAVIQNLRTTGLNKGNDFDLTRGDLIHCDYGLSRYAEAALVYKSLITPLTDKRVEDNVFRFGGHYPHSSFYSTPVNDDNFQTVMQAVQYAYDKPLEITDMSGYSSVPSYSDNPGYRIFDDYAGQQDACTFPVEFPVGDGAIDSWNQPLWSSYGIWVCRDQFQAYGRWVKVSDPLPGYLQTRTFASVESSRTSSIALRGIWTGDYFEFVIPVKNFKAGSKVDFSVPVYTRQGPVFWSFEWLDGDTWKNNDTEISSWDGKFTRKASFALKLGTTAVSQTATFANAVSEGSLRFRLKVADGSIQADSSTSSAVERSAPNHSSDDYVSVFYFHDGTATSLKFELRQ